MGGDALRATTNPAAGRIACRRLAPSIPRPASRRCLGRREISVATLRVSSCRRTRKAAFAAHENARFAGFTNGRWEGGKVRRWPVLPVREISCAAKAAFVSRRGEEARMGGGDAPTPARRSLKPGGGKSPPDRQADPSPHWGFVVARSAAYRVSPRIAAYRRVFKYINLDAPNFFGVYFAVFAKIW